MRRSDWWRRYPIAGSVALLLDPGSRRTHIVIESRRWAIPIYEFSCEACGHEFEQLVFRTGETLPVPSATAVMCAARCRLLPSRAARNSRRRAGLPVAAAHRARAAARAAVTRQELLGHEDVSTTIIYTHVLNRGWRGVRSPADALAIPQGDDASGLDCREWSSYTDLPRSLTQVGGDRRSSVSRRLRTR